MAELSDDIETQYNPRKAVPNVEAFAVRAAKISQLTRNTRRSRLDLRYGDGPLATLDVFPADAADAPLHVFLHGGYWRGRDKSDYSYVADALVPLGICTVVMNYDLCPQAELPGIVQQVREGFRWIHSHAAELGGDPGWLTASGHSAGAHLIAAALPTGADASLAGLPRAALLVSGIYELEPILAISVNQEIRLRPEQVGPMSPMRHPPTAGVALTVAVGGSETAAFVAQSRRFAETCAAQGTSTTYVELPRHDHYSIMGLLEQPDAPLARLIDGIARPNRGPRIR